MKRRSLLLGLPVLAAAPVIMAMRSPEEPKPRNKVFVSDFEEVWVKPDSMTSVEFTTVGAGSGGAGYVSLAADTPWPLSPFPPK